jgi:hypothetical protein
LGWKEIKEFIDGAGESLRADRERAMLCVAYEAYREDSPENRTFGLLTHATESSRVYAACATGAGCRGGKCLLGGGIAVEMRAENSPKRLTRLVG